MRNIRKADFFYPGFEHAGVETQFDRTMTRIFCVSAHIGVTLYNILSAEHSGRSKTLDQPEG